jgi:Sec7-like guanine-nucleotide exchange factor
MLEKFRLPGESQQIERILDAFAESFYADMCRILVYSN